MAHTRVCGNGVFGLGMRPPVAQARRSQGGEGGRGWYGCFEANLPGKAPNSLLERLARFVTSRARV